MGHTGMVGLLLEKFLQDRGRLLPIGESGVILRFRSQQRQRIKRRSFAIIGIAPVDLFHCCGVRLGALFVVAILAVVGAQGRDVVSLAITPGM